MTAAPTIDRVRAVIVQAVDCHAPDVRPEARLDDLGFDSLDRITVVMDLEEEFRVELNDDDAMGWETVGEIVASVEKAVQP